MANTVSRVAAPKVEVAISVAARQRTDFSRARPNQRFSEKVAL